MAAGKKRRTRRRYDEATVAKMVDLYVNGTSPRSPHGASTVEISKQLGVPHSTVQYFLRKRGISLRPSSVPHKHPVPEERVCAHEGCEEPVTPTGHQAAQPGGGRFCSRPCARAASRVAEPEERTCERKGCGNPVAPQGSDLLRPGRGRFCSMRCRQLYNWRADEGVHVAAHADSLLEHHGPARRKWKRIWRAPVVGKLHKPQYSEEQATLVRKLKAQYPTWGPINLSRVVSKATKEPLTPKQARGILEKSPS